jgi:predicted nucleotidyltransferase
MLEALRTRPDVTLAVLFGSTSRGDVRMASDVDVLVQLDQSSLRALSSLTDRLEEAAGRPIHLVELESAEESPLLLLEILRDGRVLADRGGAWGRLQRREHTIARAATKDNEQAADELEAAFAEVFV